MPIKHRTKKLLKGMRDTSTSNIESKEEPIKHRTRSKSVVQSIKTDTNKTTSATIKNKKTPYKNSTAFESKVSKLSNAISTPTKKMQKS